MFIISQISGEFRKYLADSLAAAGLSNQVKADDPATFDGNGASVWLYQIGVDEFSRNGIAPVIPEVQSGVAGERKRRTLPPPMGVNLHYLVTPITPSLETDQDVLAQILLAVHGNSVLSIVNYDLGLNEQVRIHVLSDNFDERVRLWEGLQDKPYRLSFTCVLRTARLFPPTAHDESVVLNLSAVDFSESELN